MVGEQVHHQVVGVVALHWLGGSAIDVVHQFGGAAELIVATVSQSEVARILHIAQRFGPSQSASDSVGATVVLVNLVDCLVGVRLQVIGVLGVSGAVLVGGAVFVAKMCTVATPRVIFKLVGKHHLTTDVEALAVVVVTAQTAVHRSHRHIACTSHRRIRLRAVAEVE